MARENYPKVEEESKFSYRSLLESNIGTRQSILNPRSIILRFDYSVRSSFCLYNLNCCDWSPLDLGNFELFLTKTTFDFVALILDV